MWYIHPEFDRIRLFITDECERVQVLTYEDQIHRKYDLMWKDLTPVYQKGYKYVAFTYPMGGRRYTRQTDRLALECILGRSLREGYEVDHIDNNINNHKLVNLQEISSVDNKRKMQRRITLEERSRRSTLWNYDKAEAARKGWRTRIANRNRSESED